MSILKLIIRGGPMDGSYDIDTLLASAATFDPTDYPAMMYSLFSDAPVGSVQRTTSPQKIDAMTRGERGKWGVHDYRITSRDDSIMEVTYLGPVAPGQLWPIRGQQ